MRSLENITVSLDFAFTTTLEISACFTTTAEDVSTRLQDCVNEALFYSTEYSSIYLFPVFANLAEKYNLEFSIRSNKTLNLFRWFYMGLLSISNYFVKMKGIEEYKRRMKVKYDGF